jgi:hypothetical protein
MLAARTGLIRQEWEQKKLMEKAVTNMRDALDACMQGKRQLEERLRRNN